MQKLERQSFVYAISSMGLRAAILKIIGDSKSPSLAAASGSSLFDTSAMMRAAQGR